jgi:hypothetical protein
MKRLLILTLFFGHLNLATAQTSTDCTLPVCDIPAQIEVLRNDSQNDRFQFITVLQKTYHNSDDATALQNLREFGTAAVALLKEVREEDWLVRAAKTLHDEAVVGLAKYERPLSSDHLISYYRELETQDTRFLILSYWTAQIPTLDDTATLSGLITFVTEARKISLAAKEDDYMLRQCDQILEKASTRYTQVNPFHEGLYYVKVTCRPDPRVKMPCSSLAMSIDRMVVMDTQSTNGLVVSMSASGPELTVFEYALASFSDRIFKGTTRTLQRPSEFTAKIDRTTGLIEGTLTTTQTLGINYDFIATPVRTGLAFDRNDPLSDQEEIAGLYRGYVGDQVGQFIVRKFSDGTYKASWMTDGENYFQIDYQTEVTVAKKGLISFVAHPPGRAELKLFLQKTSGPCGTFWSGFSLIPTGRVNEVYFEKIAPEDGILRQASRALHFLR